MTTVPVVVIGGYLGAGKTTLINRILARPPGTVWVMVNDFGEVNIDASLIRNDDGETIELTNGCICCATQDDLAGAMLRVSAARPAPDLVLIETSGVADPAVTSSYSHLPGVRHGGIVIVVDGHRIAALCADRVIGRTVRRQVEAADLIVVTRTESVVDAVPHLRSLNETAPIVSADDIDPSVLGGMDPAPGTTTHGHTDNPHTSATIHLDAPNRATALEWLDSLGADVVRAKGIISTATGNLLVERVGSLSSATPVDAPPSDGVVVIRVPPHR